MNKQELYHLKKYIYFIFYILYFIYIYIKEAQENQLLLPAIKNSQHSTHCHCALYTFFCETLLIPFAHFSLEAVQSISVSDHQDISTLSLDKFISITHYFSWKSRKYNSR